MDHQLWEVGEDLRRIRWPRLWLDRGATALVGLGVALAVSGLDNMHPKSHAVFFGMHYGYFVFAGIALVLAMVLYAADQGYHSHPLGTVQSVLKRMEKWEWIPPPSDDETQETATVSLRQWLCTFWKTRIWSLSE